MPSHHKTIISILILTILVLLGFIIWLVVSGSVRMPDKVEQGSPVIPTVQTNQNQNNNPVVQNSSTLSYSEPSFGFAFSYPNSWTVSKDTNGLINIQMTDESGPITIKKTVDKGTDSTGKFGTVKIYFDGTGWMTERSYYDQYENLKLSYPVAITPIAYTNSGLPIFNGAGRHGFGQYAYIVALSHTKFLTVTGPDNSEEGAINPYDPVNDSTLNFAKLIKV